ncbi:MAG TPA: hypothetical protein PLQ68_04470 [Clostridia bacterium]|nr:hypothetical protein [Clostridia bacterium]
MNAFEALLHGKDITTLTEEEINDLMAQMSSDELAKFEQVVKAKTPRRVKESKTSKKAEDYLNSLITKGLSKKG